MTDSKSALDELQKDFATIRRQILGAGATALTVLCAGAAFYHYVDGLKWLDAFYFCTITLTTVGYGDITPTTDAALSYSPYSMYLSA